MDELKVKEQCKGCFHFQVCANVLKQQLFIREIMFGDKNPKCEHFTPLADVVEFVHGEWLPDYETFVDDSERESEPIQTGWVCSLCGRQEFQKEPYCHCGAKMDGERKEGAE